MIALRMLRFCWCHITARVRSAMGRYCFHSWGRLSTLARGVPTLGDGYLPWMGVPTLDRDTYLGWGHLPWTGGTYPGQGVPSLIQDRSRWRQTSTVSTCYAAGGMPLAFMQEDFLAIMIIFNPVLWQGSTCSWSEST